LQELFGLALVVRLTRCHWRRTTNINDVPQ